MALWIQVRATGDLSDGEAAGRRGADGGGAIAGHARPLSFEQAGTSRVRAGAEEGVTR
jgi:hypothetical protein